MAAALLDLELSEGFHDIHGLDGHDEAFIVLRLHGVPVGHVWMPVSGGRLAADVLRPAAIAAAVPALSRRWLEHQNLPGTSRVPFTAPEATVAICTHERPDELAAVLEALARWAPTYPVLVVDNQPLTDGTLRVVQRFGGVRYVREDRLGLNVARNRALREATTPIVAFTDDDAAPEAGWVDGLVRNFDHPLVMAVTGLTLPRELATPAQIWFERMSSFGRGYFRREFVPLECSPHAAGQAGAGANMAIRRDVLDLVGGFDERLDAGTPTRSGGDHEMFARILERGYRLVYEPAAVSRHRHRRTWPELRHTIHGYGVGVYAAWTGEIVERGHWSVLRQAALWAWRIQLPALVRALFKTRGAMPLDLVLDELRGCARGPFAWFASRRQRISNLQASPA
jgi:GT2 family glycosyltransferase